MKRGVVPWLVVVVRKLQIKAKVKQNCMGEDCFVKTLV